MSIFVFSSCSKNVYKVVKYSDFDSSEERFKEFSPIDNQYYIISNNNYYYVKSDTILHFKKIKYEGLDKGLDRTIVKDCTTGRRYIMEACVDIGYYDDRYIYVNVLDSTTEEKLYCFVLDWKNKIEDYPVNELLSNSK